MSTPNLPGNQRSRAVAGTEPVKVLGAFRDTFRSAAWPDPQAPLSGVRQPEFGRASSRLSHTASRHLVVPSVPQAAPCGPPASRHRQRGDGRLVRGRCNVSRRRSKIAGQFSWRLIEMLESPAYAALSLSARRVLDRLEIELGHHGGKENGRLPVTFEHFVEYGIDRHSIAPAIRECVALGFVEVTVQGRAGNAEHRRPSLYRLTYKAAEPSKEPTDEWKRIGTAKDAEAVKRMARGGSKNRNQWGKPTPNPMGETPTENPNSPMGETLQGRNPTTSIFRVGRTPNRQHG